MTTKLFTPPRRPFYIPAVLTAVIYAPAVSDNIDVEVPWNCIVTSATLLANASGSIVIDVWHDAYGNYPPTSADSICGSAKPTISSATKSRDTVLLGWKRNLYKDGTVRLNVDSVSTITRITLSLMVLRGDG